MSLARKTKGCQRGRKSIIFISTFAQHKRQTHTNKTHTHFPHLLQPPDRKKQNFSSTASSTTSHQHTLCILFIPCQLQTRTLLLSCHSSPRQKQNSLQRTLFSCFLVFQLPLCRQASYLLSYCPIYRHRPPLIVCLPPLLSVCYLPFTPRETDVKEKKKRKEKAVKKGSHRLPRHPIYLFALSLLPSPSPQTTTT